MGCIVISSVIEGLSSALLACVWNFACAITLTALTLPTAALRTEHCWYRPNLVD